MNNNMSIKEEILQAGIQLIETNREDVIAVGNITKEQEQILKDIINKPDYAELRKRNYPKIGEQLDMIYWDMVNGTDNWKNKITEIKERFEKI